MNGMLKVLYSENNETTEIGVDEAGRGPLFGRVYTAAVVLPKEDVFDYTKLKDSKKFHSKKKIVEVYDYIKENALCYSITYEDEKVIDNINILQATQQSMHKSITEILKQKKINDDNALLLIDGNYFNSFTMYDKDRCKIKVIPHECIKGGDNEYGCIAAASILAKVERDKYIETLCDENPELTERYGINTNKGYGAKKHLDGIKMHGITKWHRKSFAPCKNF
jgi:ribonuclease HII